MGMSTPLESSIHHQTSASPIVNADKLTLRTPRGVVFADVDLSVEKGSVAALFGPSGSGRTALLLTLAGRMKPSAGTASVAGLEIGRHARRVQRMVGLGVFPGVNDLDDTISIASQVRAELVLHHLPRNARAVHDLLERFGIEANPHQEIGSLSRADSILLGVGLGLLHDPQVLMVDSADLNLTAAECARVWGALRQLADDGLTVLAACVEPPSGAYADLSYDLGATR
jgi:ABC-type multidrug transport system ATPase subunit